MTDDTLGEEDDIVEQLFPDDVPEPESRSRVTARGAAIMGARAVAGLVGVGVAVAAITASAFAPLPSVSFTPASETITPVPTAQQLVCAGSVLRLADDQGEGATTPSAISGRPSVDYAASAGPVDGTPLEQSDAGTGGTGAAPLLISTPPEGTASDDGTATLISGAQVQLADVGEFVGLTASSCASATGDSWLPAGSTTVGRTTLITLGNPTEVPATVDLELFDATGKVNAPGTNGIVVPPNGQRVLSLAGFVPNVANPVVHVTSNGGQVVANLQQVTVRGLDPGGVDIVATSAAPALVTAIPGVVITTLADVQTLLAGGANFNDLLPAVRVFAPGTGTVDGTVAIIPEDGTSTGTVLTFDFQAGQAVDVPLDELAEGSYTVVVTTSMPAVASARYSSAVGSASDFAWLASAPVLNDRALVTVADGPSPVMHLHNPGASAVTVEVAEQQVVVGPGASAALPIVPGTYELTGFGELAVAITFAGGGQVAGYPALPPGSVSTPVVVYP